MQENNKGQELELSKHLSKGNQFVLYLYKRISKVSHAIYIVTDIVKDEEPLKWTLRKSASGATSIRHFLDEHTVFEALEKQLIELEGNVEFARITKVLSEMNSAILQDQIKRLIGEIKEGSKNMGYGGKFDQSFFHIPAPLPSLSKYEFDIETKRDDQYKSHKGQNVLYDFYTQTPAKHSSQVGAKRSVAGEADKGQRREKMLKIIRVKGAVTIKDITDQIKDCSEKTIQRELTQMVLEKLLKKTGERRWSRYSVL